MVDVTEHPARAEAARIIATPVLVRESPLPVRRIVGDLTNIALVRQLLDLPEGPR